METRAHSAEADAAHGRALAAAEGRAGGAPDWSAALAHLAAAAEAGHDRAQSALAALAGAWSSARDIAQGRLLAPAEMADLRARIDMAALLRTPRPRILSAAPRIAAFEDFASDPICDWLIERARPHLAPARVYDRATAAPRREDVRSNSEYHFTHEASDLVLALVRARIAAVTGLPVAAMEALGVLHYLPGQHFAAHHDFFNVALPGHAKEVAEGGQRVLTFLLWLNDAPEGADTEFPLLGRRYRGRKGNALFFWNVMPDGRPDPITLHAGLPPVEGEKWLLSQWVRDRVSRLQP
jgi:prolyl 4-hydroxylase